MGKSLKGKELGTGISQRKDGLSLIHIFISLGWLKSIKDIYHLKDYELRMKNLEGFGSKSVTKLLASIRCV